MFRRYDHLERLGTSEVEDILFGEVFISAKLDGTNASVWYDKDKQELKAGSRNRILSLESDNAGFNAWVLSYRDKFMEVFSEYPHWVIYGEWLVKHSLTTYRDDSWKRFWIFDVFDTKKQTYISYRQYVEAIEKAGFDVIPPLCVITNPTEDQVASWLDKNTFLIQDNSGAGEGICIKNYNWKNKFGRQPWAKLVRTEFKDINRKVFGFPELNGQKMIEAEIVSQFVTEALINKTRAKIELETIDKRSLIPRLLQTVYYDLIREETWNFLKEFNFPVIDFKKLKKFSEIKIKEISKDLF